MTSAVTVLKNIKKTRDGVASTLRGQRELCSCSRDEEAADEFPGGIEGGHVGPWDPDMRLACQGRAAWRP
jgi:hypothetical protein